MPLLKVEYSFRPPVGQLNLRRSGSKLILVCVVNGSGILLAFTTGKIRGRLPGIGGDPLVPDNKTRVPHSGLCIIKIKMDVTMRIPTSSRYGVRALADLAYHGTVQPTQVKDICKRQKLSQRYLEQIFHKLLKAGLLKSKRGPRGGYALSKDPSEITVLDIVTATQGPIVPVACLNEKKSNVKCSRYA
ncbi:MAG: RrF2 family transcriptional regulator [Desulfomonilaceae bacterium]